MYRATLSHWQQLQNVQSDPCWQEKRWLFSDLSLGGWKSFSVARDFFAQCKLDFPQIDTQRATASDIKNNFSYADIIGKGIDSEAKGNIGLSSALKLVKVLLEHLHYSQQNIVFCCIEPRFENNWRYEDKAFWKYLHWYTKQSKHDILFVSTDDQQLKKSSFSLIGETIDIVFTDCVEAGASNYESQQMLVSQPTSTLLNLIPGIISPDLLQAFSHELSALDHQHISEDCILLNPFTRQAKAQVSRLIFDNLAANTKQHPWLSTYAKLHGNNHFVKPMSCAPIAWQHYADGAIELALQIMTFIVPCAQDITQKAILLCQLQGMRISLQRFQDVAEQPLPRGNVPEEILNFLWHARGWGMVFSNQPAEAKHWLDEARKNFNQNNIVEYLYFLNISALTEARLGNVDKALEIELKIGAEHAALPLTDYMLEYVNKLNTARLYRWKKDYATAEQFYLEAFATTAGCRSETDLFYVHASMALLAETQENYELAFSRWYCACLQWLACTCPEAMGIRALKILISEPDNMQPEEIVEQLASAMLEKLRGVIKRCDFKWYALLESILLSGFEQNQNGNNSSCIGTPSIVNLALVDCRPSSSELTLGRVGQNYFWCSAISQAYQPSITILNSQSSQLLAKWLGAIYVCNNRDIDTEGSLDLAVEMPRALIYANYDEQDISTNRQEAALVAWRFSIAPCEDVSTNQSQVGTHSAFFSDSIIVKIGAAVNMLDCRNHKIYFKRYLPTEVLSSEEYQVIEKLQVEQLTQFEKKADLVQRWRARIYTNLIDELRSNDGNVDWSLIVSQMEHKKLIALNTKSAIKKEQNKDAL